MRIMMLSQFYPPAIGGEEQHVQGLSAALAARGHSVAVVTLAQPDRPPFELDGAVRVYRVRGAAQRFSSLYSDPDRRFAPPAPDPEVTLHLRSLIAAERPQIVHGHNWFARSFVPLKRRTGARFLMTLHSYSLVCATERLMYAGAPCGGPGLTRCLRCAGERYGSVKGAVTALGALATRPFEEAAVDLFLPVSRAVAEGSGIARRRRPYRVIPNFVPDGVAESADEGSALLERLPSGGFILFVGDLSADKGVPLLLQAYGRLGDVPPLVLIGRRCADTPIALPGNALELGTWPRAAVMAAWRRALFGVVPSVWPDPCPSVAMEALASGRPVVASAIGGLRDIVDESCGELVRPGDVPALAAAMRRMLDDGERRRMLGEGARVRALRYKAASVVPQIEQVYEQLLASKVGAPCC